MTTLQKTFAIAIAAGFIALSVGSTVEAGKRKRGNNRRQTTQRRQRTPQRQQFNQRKNFKQNNYQNQTFQRKNMNPIKGMGQRQMGTQRNFIPKKGNRNLKWEDPTVERFNQKPMRRSRRQQVGSNKFRPQRNGKNFIMGIQNSRQMNRRFIPKKQTFNPYLKRQPVQNYNWGIVK